MGRPIIATLVVLFATLGIAVTPAQAKDRKAGADRDREALVDVLAERQARSAVMRQEGSGAPDVRSAMSSSAAEMSAGRNGKPVEPVAQAQPAESNPFRFKIGAVAVQPTVGGIKGARFSIGF